VVPSMTFCNYGEFTVAKVGNSFCNFVQLHYATNNGKIIVEAEESCIVYGMPRVVYEAGLADVQVPLSGIFHEIMLRI